MSPDGKGCMDKDECLDKPCENGGHCYNEDPRTRYRCECPDGFWGENCELVQEGQTLKLSMGALAAILVCLLVILSMLFLSLAAESSRPVLLPCYAVFRNTILASSPELSSAASSLLTYFLKFHFYDSHLICFCAFISCPIVFYLQQSIYFL